MTFVFSGFIFILHLAHHLASLSKSLCKYSESKSIVLLTAHWPASSANCEHAKIRSDMVKYGSKGGSFKRADFHLSNDIFFHYFRQYFRGLLPIQNNISNKIFLTIVYQ